MNNTILDVMQQRGKLQARIALQRGELVEIAKSLEAPLSIADQAWAAARYLISKPILVAGVAALIVLKRRGFAGLLKRVWRVWVGYRYFASLTAKHLSKP